MRQHDQSVRHTERDYQGDDPEPYGDELARRLGSRHICVDLERRTVPVSGTAIRAAPLRHWEFIPPIVRPHYVRRVALVGTESTGKTRLAEWLGQRFGTVMVREFGRPYCETRPAMGLMLSDFEARYDLVLLLDHDVPWVDDGTRVLGTRRAEHTRRLREELDAAGRQYVMLSGDFVQREREAERLVAAIVAEINETMPRAAVRHHARHGDR